MFLRKVFFAVAKRVTIQLVDDIDGSIIDDKSGETIGFAVNGVEYEIDLKAKNATEFHRKLDYYIEHATRVGGRKRKPSPRLRRRRRQPGHRPSVTRRRLGRFGSGRRTTVTRSAIAAACPPTSKRRTTPHHDSPGNLTATHRTC